MRQGRIQQLCDWCIHLPKEPNASDLWLAVLRISLVMLLIAAAPVPVVALAVWLLMFCDVLTDTMVTEIVKTWVEVFTLVPLIVLALGGVAMVLLLLGGLFHKKK